MELIFVAGLVLLAVGWGAIALSRRRARREVPPDSPPGPDEPTVEVEHRGADLDYAEQLHTPPGEDPLFDPAWVPLTYEPPTLFIETLVGRAGLAGPARDLVGEQTGAIVLDRLDRLRRAGGR